MCITCNNCNRKNISNEFIQTLCKYVYYFFLIIIRQNETNKFHRNQNFKINFHLRYQT